MQSQILKVNDGKFYGTGNIVNKYKWADSIYRKKTEAY